VRVKGQDPADGVAHTLLIRRSKDRKKHKGRADSHEIEFFLVHAPVGTPPAVMVRTAGVRWRIEEDNQDRQGPTRDGRLGPPRLLWRLNLPRGYRQAASGGCCQ